MEGRRIFSMRKKSFIISTSKHIVPVANFQRDHVLSHSTGLSEFLIVTSLKMLCWIQLTCIEMFVRGIPRRCASGIWSRTSCIWVA